VKPDRAFGKERLDFAIDGFEIRRIDEIMRSIHRGPPDRNQALAV
jgi:hypothetical protein